MQSLPSTYGEATRAAAYGLTILIVAARPALAHTAERAFVLLLPTGFYIAGGTMVVAVSFLLVAFVPATGLRALDRLGRAVGRIPDTLATGLSLISFAAMLVLVLAGHWATQDPLANPLPLAVWAVWWIGLTMVHALFGNLWTALNPWRGPYALLARLPVTASWVERPPLRYPKRLGFLPAIIQFLAFAWFELVYSAPRNPEILATTVAGYFAVNLLCALLFGLGIWMRYGEAFSVFFRVVSWLSPLNGRPNESPGGQIWLTAPGLGLLHVPPLPLSGVAFVLLALASVSFDGLSRTYWWLDNIGVNPLDFPGRSAVATANTVGLLSTFAALICGYVAAVWLGHVLAGRPGRLVDSLGRYVVSIVPIALGYHFAHYLTAFLVDAQYALIALAGPLGLGPDHVTTSFLTDYHAVRSIWHWQVGGIVVAHVVAVAVAHVLAVGRLGRRQSAMLAQLPLTLLMVGYTLFGLWLLASPAVG